MRSEGGSLTRHDLAALRMAEEVRSRCARPLERCVTARAELPLKQP
jgi:hypothetical protein